MQLGDSYTALWVSHTSISDFLNCPRAYYLKNVYRDPKTGHRVKLVSPPLTLGQVVHGVLDTISTLPTEKRFEISLANRLDQAWGKFEGKRGGFANPEQEFSFKTRGIEMLNRLTAHPGPLSRKAVKIKSDKPILYSWLSQEDNIILCGKVDWLEYLEDRDTVHIIDFKTSKTDEHEGSLQLPIYYLLVKNAQKRIIEKISYWYIARLDEPTEKALPDEKESQEKLLEVSKKIKLAKKLNVFKCPHGDGCRFCKPYEKIVKKEAEFLLTDENGADLYFLPEAIDQDESEVL